MTRSLIELDINAVQTEIQSLCANGYDWNVPFGRFMAILKKHTKSAESAWLIERPLMINGAPKWWNPVAGWVTDANKATRYARKEDAEATIAMASFVKDVFASEHIFDVDWSKETWRKDYKPSEYKPTNPDYDKGRHGDDCIMCRQPIPPKGDRT